MAISLQTPGVYTVEVDAFGNSVVPVATAIPAFVGYTARADYRGKSVQGQAMLITSLQEFLAYFGAMGSATAGSPPQALPPSGQYKPVYHVSAASGTGDISICGTSYDIEPDPGTIYYLYNSIRLFYANGGGTAYVVSVGPYGKPTGKPKAAAARLVNPNIKLSDLQKGLAAVAKEPDPTMLVVPDATLLSEAENGTLMEDMVNQCGKLGSRVAILDVPAGLAPDPLQWTQQITKFRTSVGMNFLKYAAAYFPYLETTITGSSDIDYTTCGGAAALTKILPDAGTDPVKSILASISKPATGGPTSEMNNAALKIASPTYGSILDAVLGKINTLPPSGAMAGIYTLVDGTSGVWKAPANVSLTSVTGTTFRITDSMQASLNVDAITGKSINAIRVFTGKGVLVWGARTLDGNRQAWRYINVRRTMIMLEQSIKLAANAYVFEPNDANTWSTVDSSISSFLNGLWAQGALAGAKPDAAYKVAVGLGATMTGQDILDGRMNIMVKVAIVHPAEFIVITYSQMMQTS